MHADVPDFGLRELVWHFEIFGVEDQDVFNLSTIVEAHVALGYLAENRHDLENARRHYRKALWIKPDMTSAKAGLKRIDEALRADPGKNK